MASLAKNSIYNTLGIVVYVLLMLIITPLLINAMGDLQYGLYRLALSSVVNYCFFLDLESSSGILLAFAD